MVPLQSRTRKATKPRRTGAWMTVVRAAAFPSEGCHPGLGSDLDAELDAYRRGELSLSARAVRVSANGSCDAHRGACFCREDAVDAALAHGSILASSVVVRQTSASSFLPPGSRIPAAGSGGRSESRSPNTTSTSSQKSPRIIVTQVETVSAQNVDCERSAAARDADAMLEAMSAEEIEAEAASLRATLPAALLRRFSRL